jgi:hypothetical protein
MSKQRLMHQWPEPGCDDAPLYLDPDQHAVCGTLLSRVEQQYSQPQHYSLMRIVFWIKN